MLGLSASINSEESYAKGERYRERYHSGGSYHYSTNPIGKSGKESDYLGEFSNSTDDDDMTTSNATIGIISGTLRIRVSADDGYVSISVNTIPGVNYIVSYLNDPNNSANSNGVFKVGATANSHSIGKTNVVHATDDNSAKSLTFTALARHTFVSWSVNDSGGFMFLDKISVKEA
tara:strand:- start:3036 stop:3560 length:525 start_codon:yes stop_codon:yes gene_type:complete